MTATVEDAKGTPRNILASPRHRLSFCACLEKPFIEFEGNGELPSFIDTLVGFPRLSGESSPDVRYFTRDFFMWERGVTDAPYVPKDAKVYCLLFSCLSPGLP